MTTDKIETKISSTLNEVWANKFGKIAIFTGGSLILLALTGGGFKVMAFAINGYKDMTAAIKRGYRFTHLSGIFIYKLGAK